MNIELTAEAAPGTGRLPGLRRRRSGPHATRLGREEALSPEVVRSLAEKDHLGSIVPKELAGLGLDMITYGVLSEELGRGCSSSLGWTR